MASKPAGEGKVRVPLSLVQDIQCWEALLWRKGQSSFWWLKGKHCKNYNILVSNPGRKGRLTREESIRQEYFTKWKRGHILLINTHKNWSLVHWNLMEFHVLSSARKSLLCFVLFGFGLVCILIKRETICFQWNTENHNE